MCVWWCVHVCVCVGGCAVTYTSTCMHVQQTMFLCVYHCQYTGTHTHTHTHTSHTGYIVCQWVPMHHASLRWNMNTELVRYHMIYGLSIIYPPPICKPYLSPYASLIYPHMQALSIPHMQALSIPHMQALSIPICKPYLSPICKLYARFFPPVR